ncbi:hypothetical protein D9M69_476150 [compost metagenome]
MDADAQLAVGQLRHRQRIVDLGGGDVVDRERLDLGQRQVGGRLGHVGIGKGGALGEALGEELGLVQRTRAGDAANGHHQPHRRHAERGAGRIHGLVFQAVLVRLEQQLQHLVAERFRQRQRLELFFIFGLHQRLLALALERGQRGLELVLGRALVAATPLAAEVHRVAVQRHRKRRLLHRAGLGAVVFGGQLGKAELGLGGAFPEEVQVDLGHHVAGLADQLERRRLRKLQQHVARLDLGALAGRQLHLVSLALLVQHGAGADLAAFFEQQLHRSVLSEMRGTASGRHEVGAAADPVGEMVRTASAGGARYGRRAVATRPGRRPGMIPHHRCGPPARGSLPRAAEKAGSAQSDMPPLASIATPLT